MALDPNIALGVRGIELPNQLAQYAQVAQIQQAQQAQQMNALKMQEYQQEIQHNNALRQSAAPEGINPEHWQINPTKALALAKTAAETRNLGATGRHLEAQTKDLTIKALGNTFDNFTKLNPPTTAAASPQGVAAYITNLYADPLLGAVAAKQMPLEDAIKINTEGWTKDPNAWIAAHSGLTGEKLFDTLKGTRQNTAQGGVTRGETVDVYGRVVPGSAVNTPVAPLPADVEAQKARIAMAGRTPAQPSAPVAVIGPDGKPMYVSREQAMGMTPATNAATLKPLTEGQTIKLRTDVGKDYQNASTALSQIDDLLASADSVKKAPGLSAATGYTGKYLPSFSEGGAAQAETRLANLRGKVTALGKATASMGGAIGSIATQEWKVLADQVAVLDETKGKKPLLEQIGLLEDQARRSAELIRDKYEKTRAEDFERFPQFRDLPTPKSSVTKNPAAGSIHDQADAILRGGK